MRSMLVTAVSLAALAGCSTGGTTPTGRPDVVEVDDEADSRAYERNGRTPARGPRALHGVPPGHYPARGECRVWFPGRPPGRQPVPARCETMIGRLPAGAFLLYGDRAWDLDYDWASHERRAPGSVPGIVLRLVSAPRRT